MFRDKTEQGSQHWVLIERVVSSDITQKPFLEKEAFELRPEWWEPGMGHSMVVMLAGEGRGTGCAMESACLLGESLSNEESKPTQPGRTAVLAKGWPGIWIFTINGEKHSGARYLLIYMIWRSEDKLTYAMEFISAQFYNENPSSRWCLCLNIWELWEESLAMFSLVMPVFTLFLYAIFLWHTCVTISSFIRTTHHTESGPILVNWFLF